MMNTMTTPGRHGRPGTEPVSYSTGSSEDYEDPALVNLRLLSSLFVPMPEDERERRSQAYARAGVLTRETVMRALLGEFG